MLSEIVKANDGQRGYNENMLLADYMALWMEEYCRNALKLSTFLNRQTTVNCRIIPAIGHLRLSELRPIHFVKFYNSLRAEGLSGDYVHNMHSIMRTAMRHAEKWQIVSSNIMKLVDAPKKSEKKSLQVWSLEQATTFLKFTGALDREYFGVPRLLGDYRHIAYVIAIFTGMRRGEVLGLRWCDVDFERSQLRVMQTVYKPTGMAPQIQSTKTSGSVRSITVTEHVLNALKVHRAMQREIRVALGADYKDHDLICPRADGMPMDPRGLLEHFDLCIERSGLPRIRFHDLRHTHATLMLQLGQHPKVVSERLGHSNVNITLDRYSHVLPNMQADAARMLSDAFKSSGL